MTIEEAVRAKLLTMSAVTAITTTIRADEFAQTDKPPGILISVVNEKFDNDVGGRSSSVEAQILVSSVTTSKRQSRTLAEAIRTNGTNPGTGLHGVNVTTGDLPFRASLDTRNGGYIANPDGSDSGYYTIDSYYTMLYEQIA